MDSRKFADLIMPEQTLFSLPFALIGVLFAGGGTFAAWIWVIVALAAARTAGMSFNRVLDKEIDAKNPRTRERILPKGDVSRFSVWLTGIVSVIIFILAAFMLNELCFYLSFLCIFLLFTYSFLKRFTAASHFYLGLIEAAAPAGGYIAVTGHIDMVAIILGLIIMAWIAGLDIVYALQDMEFDVGEKLHSLPIALDRKRALLVSRLCYLAAFSGLLLVGTIARKDGPFLIATIVVGLIFLYQQVLASRDDHAGVIPAIFKANLFVSPLLFLGTLVDLWAGGAI